ncbi:TIGR02680 family protein [Phytoactinopolyspora mesophila]|uniref:TIGR02680 family protein n=1 Tax=Phytoactinopolyspora mesophila TaxID=2650750 RepID=A0A7K3LXJ7_9ACTN|nr:TIGR02680 family protein [Phytoactinopolyspora mesophila]NDL55759.1 TIGR02680 family protein [Phytoactinopolyspora mesophila]
MSTAIELPAPSSSRWQPLRLGLIDLFYYDDEVFPFVDGRLLLRGNNGTGKSKVLALTLPFLLDADLSARRVEPDADPNKRMEWNLLLGGAHPNQERLGYAWLEFGCVGADGSPLFCTLGAGLKAVAGRGMVKHWFFVTSQRVGDDLALLDSTRTALSRERLSEALDTHGRIYDAKRDYRRAVDENLFGLGERRYDALVDLLVQLRQPQLSKRPSERALSDALTESLPPVRADLIDYVAEGFRGLDEEREQLEQLSDTARSAEAFLEHYRRYAQVISRRRAQGPRQAQATFEHLGRELLRAQEALHEQDEAATAAGQQVATLRQQLLSLEAEWEALLEGEHAEAEAQLSAAEREKSAAQDRARDTAEVLESATRELVTADEVVEAVRADAESAAEQRETAGAQATEAAGTAGVATEHAGAVADVDVAVDAAKQATHDVVQRRRRAITRVRDLMTAAEKSDQELAAAQRWLDEMAALLDRRLARQNEADAAATRAGEELVAQVRSHLQALVEVQIGDVVPVLDALQEWGTTLEGANPAAAALAEAAQRVRDEIAETRARGRARDGELEAHADELEQEIADLEQGRSQPPPARHTRNDDMPGVPLWRSIDFAETTSPGERAGFEAALEAAGLLDAHILPGGEVRSPADGELLLEPRPVDGASDDASAPQPVTLAGVLRPELPPDAAGVRVSDVNAVLRSVGVRPASGGSRRVADEAPAWVSADGRFQLGVVTGAWSKTEASYIGEGAREAARQRRMAEARAELEAVRIERAEVARLLDQLEERARRVQREVDELPSDSALRDSYADVKSAHDGVVEATGQRDGAVAAVDEARAKAQRDAAELAETAATLDLPTTRADLEEVSSAVNTYAAALASLWHAVDVAAREARRLAAAETTRLETAKRHASAGQRKQRSDDELAAAETRYQTLESTVGADVREFQQRRLTVKRNKQETEAQLESAREHLTQVREKLATMREQERQLSEQQHDADNDRSQAIAALRRTTSRGVLGVACPTLTVPDPDEEWSIAQAVALARTVEQELSEIEADDAAYERVYARLGPEVTALQTALSRHGHSAVGDPNDDGYTVSVLFGGRQVPVPELVVMLREDIEARERLLGAREREIIENHLVTEVGANLADLVAEAEAQVRALNEELSERPTSTGMKLRVVWRLRRDGPAGLPEARRRLLQLADAWSAEDRREIGGFLQAQINDERDHDETGTWHEHLERALDYRSWHEFTVERYQNGAWRSASGPASGGERVLAASIPLFAAASSHYRTATKPHAARLVTLDEAFAGVDDDSRAKSLGLLRAFDLDVVMTSEREWGCYPEVPGLSIAQLSRVEGIPAVLVTLWEWDGLTRTRVERDSDPEPAAGSLWT